MYLPGALLAAFYAHHARTHTCMAHKLKLSLHDLQKQIDAARH